MGGCAIFARPYEGNAFRTKVITISYEKR